MKFRKMMILLTALLLFAGCSAEANSSIKSIEDVDSDKLAEYNGTYVGDNSDVLAIIRELAGAETFTQLDLRNQEVKVLYGSKKDSLPEEEVLEYWFNGEETMEKNFLYNGIFMSLLVPNAKAYEFTMDGFSLSFKRKDMIQQLEETFADFPTDEAAWDQQAIQEFIDRNHESIKEMVNSAEQRKDFFQQGPLTPPLK